MVRRPTDLDNAGATAAAEGRAAACRVNPPFTTVAHRAGGGRGTRDAHGGKGVNTLGRGRRVLVVDDDPDVRLTMSAFLGRAGYEVFTAGSGDEAFAWISASPAIAALVTDYAMPGMNGVELVLRARELSPGLPALVVTGYAGAEGLTRLPQDVTVLRKPFLKQEFLGALAALVEGVAAG